MLQSRGTVALFATAAGASAFHAVRLSWALFLEYMSSPTFGGDVADALCNYDSLSSFFESGFKFSALAELYAKVLGTRLTYRFTECAVSAACAFSPSPFLHGAVVFHYLYPTVQEYRFGRCWLTRLLRLAASCVVPKFLRRAKISPDEDPDGAYLQRPPAPLAGVSASTMEQYKARVSAAVGGPPPGAASASPSAEQRARWEKETDFFAREEAVFEAMPAVCAATLRYYVYSYHSAPFKTIVQAGFIPDVSRVLVELGQWGILFGEEQRKMTSRWRIWKRFIADQTATVVQIGLSYSIRYLGARFAMKLFSEPTGGAIFWTESMLHFAFAMQILSTGMLVRVLMMTLLDKRFPATTEDLEEERREQAEAEESAARSDAWARMTSEELHNAGNPHKQNGHGTSNGDGSKNSLSSSGGNFVNLYAVLSVSDTANQAEIKKAYRQLALKNHPDRVGGDGQAQKLARERMATINEAYDTLMDSRKKAQYDARRRMANAPSFVDKLDKMPAPKLVGLTVGMASLVGIAGYAHFVATFQRVTASGCAPLVLFGGV